MENKVGTLDMVGKTQFQNVKHDIKSNMANKYDLKVIRDDPKDMECKEYIKYMMKYIPSIFILNFHSRKEDNYKNSI
jgi:hypothetical protein